jgi:hypothetical protein
MVTHHVYLPEFHASQAECYLGLYESRFNVARCGRRWGKTKLAVALAADTALKGHPVGWFGPEFKFVTEPFLELDDILSPVLAKRGEGAGRKYEAIRLITKGGVDFWSLDNDKAGRGRKYKRVVIDEAAFTKPGTLRQFQTVIAPTLLDLLGDVWVLSNTNGVDEDNFLYQICHDAKHGFKEFHAPTWSNPMMDADEIERLRATVPPLVFKQEYGAEFVDWRGVRFFDLNNCLDPNGKPYAPPKKCDAVFVTIDSALKTGAGHDGVAAVYWATNKAYGVPLFALDWELAQIEGGLLEHWLPGVLRRAEELAREAGARYGSLGAFVEDKVSGTVLIQQAQRRGLPARAIDSRLTAMGKDERALSVSGYVYQRKVGICAVAYDRVSTYKERSRNHFVSQVFGYELGMAKKLMSHEDDCLDAWCYGIAIALGDIGGF